VNCPEGAYESAFIWLIGSQACVLIPVHPLRSLILRLSVKSV